ncbi:MAG: tRNA (N6-threonylcarbamoyladenosine(37)-N6)-methyltransferase TrmO [Tissierellaceae bacterium]
MDIVMEPIGFIKSPYKDTREIPRQSIYSEDKRAVIEVLPKFSEGLEGIQENAYGVILFYFHQSKEAPLRLLSRKTNEMTGVFATRSPNRPNGIGISIVKFIKIEENRLEFQGVDMVDGTPVLDIKPYSPDLNPREDNVY